MKAIDRLIAVLDFSTMEEAKKMVETLGDSVKLYKVGLELFLNSKGEAVDYLKNLGKEVFLDLKFHDIPNTTAQAVCAAGAMGVWMVNVHASGGRKMMETCVQRLKAGNYSTQLIAVTVLTSMGREDLKDLGLDIEPFEQVKRLAKLTQESGLDGVVCSAQEAVRFKQVFGQEFKLVTPGIRPQGSDAGDQRRIMTPEQAQTAGVDYMVIGRPVTQSADPAQTLRSINASLNLGA